MNYSPEQKKILEEIINKYESSKTYTGENKINRSFRVQVIKIWPQYNDSFTDICEIEDIEKEINTLIKEGLIQGEKEKTGAFNYVCGIKNAFPRYYQILDRKEKNDLINEELELYSLYKEKNDTLGYFCKAQIELLNSGKKASYNIERGRILISLLSRILNNKEVLYERELSVEILHDSKLFEQSFRSPVCKILRNFGDYENIIDGEEDERIVQMLILEKHQIYANPRYIYIKGEAKLCFSDGSSMLTKENLPIALSMDLINQITEINTEKNKIITIENLTTFHRFNGKDFLCIFLSGYHSSCITTFLRKIKDKDSKNWYHYGDIDPDGFMILRNLMRKTQLSFIPYCMDIDTITKNKEYIKPLDPKHGDCTKAESLIKEGFYPQILNYMLSNNCKLEQEVHKE